MDTYTIKTAYPYEENSFELTIESDNLMYSELGKNHAGCQSINMDNNKLIEDKCREVANLIREIDKLNCV